MASLNDFTDSNTGLTNIYMEGRESSRFFSKKTSHYTLNGKESEDTKIVNDVLKGIVEISEVSRFFFSAKNINHLNKLISKKVEDNIAELVFNYKMINSDSVVSKFIGKHIQTWKNGKIIKEEYKSIN